MSEDSENEATLSQIIVSYAFAVLYLPFCVFCIIQIIRIYRKNKENQLQKSQPQRNVFKAWGSTFYPLVLLGCACRAAYLFTWPWIYIETNTLFLINFIPSLTFFSAFLVILFCWARIYHSSFEVEHPFQTRNLKNLLVIINILMYTISLVLYIFNITFYPHEDKDEENPFSRALELFVASLYVLASAGFTLYTILIHRKMKRITTLDSAVSKIHYFTFVVVISFLLRAALVASDSFFNLSVIPYLQPVYYLVLEVLPLSLMIYILRMEKRRRVGTINASSPLLKKTLPLY